MKKKILVGGLIALAAIVLVNVTIVAINPLRMPAALIKKNMLKLAPIGTSTEDVIEVIRSNKEWKGTTVNDGRDANGFLSKDCKKSMSTHIGKYPSVSQVYVDVLWGFDENSKLIDIYVWKDSDIILFPF